VHEEGFGVQSLADGAIVFTDPQGHRVPDAAETRFRGNAVSLMDENDQSDILITPQTGECLWDGERMDDDLAVLCMLQLDA
jgi:hypothetical protein